MSERERRRDIEREGERSREREAKQGVGACLVFFPSEYRKGL